MTGIEIRQLEPGTLMRRSARGKLATERWAAEPFTGPPQTVAVGDLAAAMEASLQRHLVSDVEVGLLLSGGLDSRLVLSFARAAGASPKCFTITFAGHGDYDEGGAASEAARAFGVEHIRRDLHLDFDSALDDVTRAFDLPFADSSAIATLAVSRLAREHVKVVLTGTGGDDLFAGYFRHRAHLLTRPVARLPRRVTELVASAGVPRGSERRSALRLARSYAARLASAADADPLQAYLALAASQGSSSVLGSLWKAGGLELDEARRSVARRQRLGEDVGTVVSQIQAFECRTYLPGDLLVKEDRATMAVGLEGRVPMLDPAVLAVAGRLRDSEKIGLFSGKRALRQLGREVLPSDVGGGGRKRGFAVPLGALLSGSWRDPAVRRLRDSDSEMLTPHGRPTRSRRERYNRRTPGPSLRSSAGRVDWQPRGATGGSQRRSRAAPVSFACLMGRHALIVSLAAAAGFALRLLRRLHDVARPELADPAPAAVAPAVPVVAKEPVTTTPEAPAARVAD